MGKKSLLKKIVCLLLAVTLSIGICASFGSCANGSQDDEGVWIGPY